MKTNQSCKCIDLISKNIKKTHGEFHFTNLGSYIDTSDPGSTVAGLIYKPMPLFFEVRKKNKDGTNSSKWIKRSIGLAYCPFCGTKY